MILSGKIQQHHILSISKLTNNGPLAFFKSKYTTPDFRPCKYPQSLSACRTHQCIKIGIRLEKITISMKLILFEFLSKLASEEYLYIILLTEITFLDQLKGCCDINSIIL